MIDDIREYNASLWELGADKLVANTVAGSPDFLLDDVVFNSLFYFVEDESNIYNESTSRNKESAFEECLLLLNSEPIFRFFHGKKGHGDGVLDVTDIRKIIFENVLGKYNYTGLRRYRNRCGIYITINPSDIESALQKQYAELNHASMDPISSFLAATLYLVEFMKIHPVEEGDSRVGRMVVNNFLVGRSLRHMTVTDNRDSMMKMIECFCFSGYVGSLLALALSNALKERNDRAAVARIINTSGSNTYTRELRDLLLIYLDRGSLVDVKEEINFFYKLGCESEHFLKTSLWLIFISKDESSLLKKIYDIGDEETKLLALLVMEQVDSKLHKEVFVNALQSKKEAIRMAAVGILGRSNLLDEILLLSIAHNEKSDVVLALLGRVVRRIAPTVEVISVFKNFIQDGSVDVKVGGYYGLIRTGTDKDIVEALKANFGVENGVIKKVIIEELSTAERINSDGICAELVELVNEDEPRRTLLGELTRKSKINPGYLSFIDKVIGSGSPDERAYALYLLGREMGLKYVEDHYPIGSGNLSIPENLSVSILKVMDQTGNKIEDLLFTNTERRRNMHIAFEIIRHLNSGRINEYRLLTPTSASDHINMIFDTFIKRLQANGGLKSIGIRNEKPVETYVGDGQANRNVSRSKGGGA